MFQYVQGAVATVAAILLFLGLVSIGGWALQKAVILMTVGGAA